jgi:hypothetical protein
VVLTTIVLYYLYYVEGAVTPLMLPYYDMSFQYLGLARAPLIVAGDVPRRAKIGWAHWVSASPN